MAQEKKSIYALIVEVQNELKAPKGNFNSFGKYKYRSAEDILEAVKPILHSKGLYLNLSDEIVMVGDRWYVKSTTSIWDVNGCSIVATAYAREADKQSGMSDSQLTGTTSSYARKYALNGLFGIDDTKDDDTGLHSTRENQTAPKPVDKVAPTKVEVKETGALKPSEKFEYKIQETRKVKAAEAFEKLDKHKVLEYLIKTAKLKHTSVDDFINKEDIKTIEDIYTAITSVKK